MVLRTRMYDMIHRTVVSGLMGFTAVGSVWLGYKGVLWYLYRYPELKEAQRIKKEEKIAKEQQERENELLNKQMTAEKSSF